MGVGCDWDDVEDESDVDFWRNNSGARRINSSTWNELPDYSNIPMNLQFH